MIPQAASAEILVRHCHGLSEFEACVELQKRVWSGADIDVVPLPLFVVAAETGGQVLGAFAGAGPAGAGEKMIGFTMALAGVREGKPYLHSHMTAVLEGHRDRGIGRKLKLFQRQDALGRGITLVEWTFDPLELKNAHFNLMRLGAIVRRFLPNCYGITSSPLHGGLPTDRLVAEWWLASHRVEILAEPPPLGEGTGNAVAMYLPRAESVVSIRVPANIGELRQHDSARALRVQSEIREQFQHWLGRGYAATAVALKADGGNYLLAPWAQP